LYEILYQLNNNYSSLLNIIEPTTKEKLIIRINQDINKGDLLPEFTKVLNINMYNISTNNLLFINNSNLNDKIKMNNTISIYHLKKINRNCFLNSNDINIFIIKNISGLLFLEYNTISPLNINIIICYQLIDNNIIYIQSTSNKTLYYKISNVKEWKDFLNNKKVIFERSYIYTNNISLKYESIESL